MENSTSVRRHAKNLFAYLFLTVSFALSFNKLQAQDKDYKFKLGIDYTVTTDDKKQDMSMWVSDKDYTGMEAKQGDNSVFIIFNMNDKKMVTVMEAQKMAMIMDLTKYQDMIGQKIDEAKDSLADKTKIEKTGVKEKIAGYTCDQYKITSDKTETLVWTTKELGSGFSGFWKSFVMAFKSGKSKGPSIPNMNGVTDGVMMKMESTDLSNNKKTTIEATAVNKDGKEVNISDYKMMSM